MIRQNFSVSDTQAAIFALLKKLTGTVAPWSSWEALLGYPEGEKFAFAKQLIYVMPPVKAGYIPQQGGRSATIWEMALGVWGKGGEGGTGGEAEADIAAGHLLDLFGCPDAYAVTFNLTLGATSYTNTTLRAQGITLTGTSGPILVPVEEPLEFRREISMSLITTF